MRKQLHAECVPCGSNVIDVAAAGGERRGISNSKEAADGGEGSLTAERLQACRRWPVASAPPPVLHRLPPSPPLQLVCLVPPGHCDASFSDDARNVRVRGCVLPLPPCDRAHRASCLCAPQVCLSLRPTYLRHLGCLRRRSCWSLSQIPKRIRRMRGVCERCNTLRRGTERDNQRLVVCA